MFYKDKEYQAIHNNDVNVQSIVEKPYIYILARCPSNDQQILYCEERIEDIHHIDEEFILNGIPFLEKMRFFKRDMPASQFEAEQQK